MLFRPDQSSWGSASKWGCEFAYAGFVFVTMYLLVVFEAVIDTDNHAIQTWRSVCWTGIQTGISCMLVASLAGVFGRFAKVIHSAIFLIVGKAYLADLCELYVRRHFTDEMVENGDIWLLVLRNSSWNEVVEFLSDNIRGDEWVILALFFAFFIVIFVALFKLPIKRLNLKLSFVCLVSCVAFTVCTFTSLPYKDLLAQAMFDSRISGFYLDDLSFETLVGIGKKEPEPNRFVAECTEADQPFGLIVFGESATRRHWSHYGYPRRTTPKIESLSNELVTFTSVRASHWLTIQAMACMLTGAEIQELAGRFALPSIIKSIGRKSSFFSGQSHWGHIDGVDTLFFSQCTRKTYLADSHAYGTYWDYDLIDAMADDFSANSGVDVCFVHLMGSHFEFEKRFPAEYALFSPNYNDLISRANPERRAKIAAYDNSIAYTDKVIADMIESVRASRRNAFVLYVSDHGESPETRNRDLSQDSIWEVPMVVWFSAEYRHKFPHVVQDLIRKKDDMMTNAAVYDLVLQLLRIYDTEVVGRSAYKQQK